ncbi:MAG: phosphatase PAP2 family protein [Candidatus Micrarchaeota archaeon]|nr:phosphatase PAP2 family protein [Candidatus Micrarchaeota archaeon]
MAFDLTAFFSVLDESYFVVIPLLAIWLYYKKDKNVFSFVSAFIILYVVADVLKMLIAQPRPCAGLPGCEPGYGMPSNHATALTGPYLFLMGYRYLRWMYPVWLIFVLFGRVYLDQHTLVQVLAGMAISLILGYVLYRYKERINGIAMSVISRIPVVSRLLVGLNV